MAIHIQNPPEAKPERLSRLITRIENGDVKIPVFQRKFVWKQNQVIELLDSIYRGYPIGSLLFWLTSEKLSTERDLGDFDLPETLEKYPRNYILDGQQRLSAIYGVLRWNGMIDEDSIYNISFDLTEKKFFPTQIPVLNTHIPMNILFDAKNFRYFQTTLNRPETEELLEASEVLSETFREYAIPVITVTEATVEHVASIFERINSTGTKLTVYDLMVAATWSEKFDLRNQIDEALNELKTKDYGDISPVAILQLLAASNGESANRQTIMNLRKIDSNVLTDHMEEVREALKKAVDFLINEVHIKSSDFLPYERQLVAISYAILKKKKLSVSDINVLKKWFWRTSFSERYRRGGEGLFDEDLLSISSAFDNENELDRFGVTLSDVGIKNIEFRKTSALSNAFIALLASMRPKNLINGSYIDTGKALSNYNKKEFHHIFPQAFLLSKGVSKTKINSIANICMLSAEQNKIISDRKPSEYFWNLINEHKDNCWEIFESNLIPQEAVDAALRDDFERFIYLRSIYISETILKVI